MKVNIKKIKQYSGKFLKYLAQRIFLGCLLLLLLNLCLGSFLYYNYIILAQKLVPGDFKYFQLKEDLCQKVFDIWQGEEQRFQQADSKKYPSPFRRMIIEPEQDLTE